MAANRPNLGLQVALIIFVLITIALAVSTFMFFKQDQESQLAKKDAEAKAVKFVDEKQKAERELGRLKTIVGKGDPDKVDTILEEFEADKKLYGPTYPEPAQTYPQMLKNLVDIYNKQNGDLATFKAEIDKLKQVNGDTVKAKQNSEEVANAALNSVKTEYMGERAKFDADRGEFEGAKAGLAKRVEDKQKLITDFEAKAKDDLKKRDEAISKQKSQIAQTQNELKTFTKTDIDAPDGTIVRVNQRDQTVWIDLGQEDGLKRQMTFTVYDASVSNVAGDTIKSKGSIEVTRIIDGHLAEARITKEELSRPIERNDKIESKVFRRGMPEHFAVAGFIDIDGDNKSDLKQLLILIANNGGLVDAIVDEQGHRSGAVTPSTKLVIVGATPTGDVKGGDAMQAYSQILKQAADNGVATMPLDDFLKYMGYEGTEKSTPLGKNATAPHKPGDKDKDHGSDAGTFRKRPAKGADGGAFQ